MPGRVGFATGRLVGDLALDRPDLTGQDPSPWMRRGAVKIGASKAMDMADPFCGDTKGLDLPPDRAGV